MAGDEELSPLDDWGADDDWTQFLVPPPPPPPSLGSVCTDGDFYCQLEGGPMGTHFGRTSFPSLPIIAVCSSVVLVAVLVASFLLWRHKTKVQNLLPCKSEQQGHIGDLGAANGVTYEDVLINHHPTRIPQAHLAGSQTLMPLELLDVKLGDIGPPQISTFHQAFYPGRDHHATAKSFNPVYEEVSQAASGDKSLTGKSYESDLDESGKVGGRSITSEDDFAEDEFSAAEGSGQCSATSSVRGSTGGDLCKDPVSSDEGTGEDCEYIINDVPAMLPGDNSFNYPMKQMRLRPDVNADRPCKLRNPGQPLRGPTYPRAERTANQEPPAHRIGDSALHSTSLTDSKKHLFSPTRISNAQWLRQQEAVNFPPSSSSQENIYSTIDEDELTDYPVHPLTSLACSQHGSPPSKPKSSNIPSRADVRTVPPLSQRNAEDNGSSYGDMMPAFNTTSFT